MIDFLKQQIENESSSEARVNRLRETLQLVSLKILNDKGYFSHIAFVGGTALRILYDMRRFSEDMDFSVIDKKGYDFRGMIAALKREFKLRGLELEAEPRVEKTVEESMLKFPGLLKALSLSEMASQKLSIRLEVDSNPPAGADIESTVVNKIYVLNITHLSLPSLYATKLHACFFRKYTKGRDFYDLIWYLGKKVKPNYKLLNNAILQTEEEDLGLDEENIKDFLLERLKLIDFRAVRKDVERFLEDKGELGLLNKDVIAKGIIDVFMPVH